MAKLADCGTLGCGRVGWGGLGTHLEYPMGKFLWHFVLRGGRFQGARAENTSAGTWMRGMIPMQHPLQGLCGVKTCLESDPNFSHCSKSTGLDGLTRSPTAEVHMSESSLAPKITLKQFSALVEPIKFVVTFGAVALRAEDFGRPRLSECSYWTAAVCPSFIKTQGWML